MSQQGPEHPPTPQEVPPAEPRPSPPPSSGGAVEQRIPQAGSLPGNRYLVVRREDLGAFRRDRQGMLVATERAEEPQEGLARTWFRMKRALVGRSLPTAAAQGEQLPVRKALPTLASDALSSVAYGPEAGLSVLALAGIGAFAFELPIAIAIAALMVLVVLSYRQLVLTRPADGGSYAMARDHLGRWPAMVAAAALLVDYVLTVAVSVSSGSDALASAFPSIVDLRLPLAVLLALLLCAGNLRGVREAGALFAAPTYIFVVAMAGLIVVGLVRGLLVGAHHAIGVYPPIAHPVEEITPFLILTAFASGCSSMTGVEAVSDSVRSFKAPQGPNAARTLAALGSLLVVIFLGITLLDVIYGVAPHPSGSPTVLAQIAADVFSGRAHFLFYVIQFATMLVLILAANASFNGFPRLCAVLARDNNLPHRFGAFGDRLVYSAGILVLAAVSVLVVGLFRANTDHLINLYAIGVFTAFTLAQSALIRYELRRRPPHWRRNLVINGMGATATLIVDVIVMVVKFRLGAWVVLILVPLMVWYFWSVSRHYRSIRAKLAQLSPAEHRLAAGSTVVPVLEMDSAAERDLLYATTLGHQLTVLNLASDPGVETGIRKVLERAGGEPSTSVRILNRPRPDGLRALPELLDEHSTGPRGDPLTVLVPAYLAWPVSPALLRRRGGLRLRLALLRRHDVVTASVPSAWPGPAPLLGPIRSRHRVALVPISALEAPAARGLSFAQSIADEVVAIHVATGQVLDSQLVREPRASGSEDLGVQPDQEARALADSWDGWIDRYLSLGPGQPRPQLALVVSPYRTVVHPVLRYLQVYREAHRDDICTVLLTELVSRHLWNQLLHNHRPQQIKAALLGQSDFAVAEITYDLSDVRLPGDRGRPRD